MASNQCEECNFYMYDEDYEEYICSVNMDEDEYFRFINDSGYQCPYFQSGDEYKIVRKQ